MIWHSRLKKWLFRTGITLECIVLILLGAAGAHYLIAQQKLESVCAHMRADSIPFTWEEYYLFFPNAEIHLAAQPQFLTALDNLSHLNRQANEKRGESRLPYYPRLKSNLTPEMFATLDDHIHFVAPALEDVRKAVAAEPFWLIPPAEYGLDDDHIPRLTKAREPIRLFSLQAMLHAERNEPQAAIRAVVDAINTVEVLHRGSFAIDEILRFAAEGIALASFEYVLAKTDPPRDSLHDMQAILSTHTDMRTGILGECIFMKQGYAEPMQKLPPIELELWLEAHDLPYLYSMFMYLPYLPGWMNMNEAYHLETIHSVIRNWNLPWQEFTSKHEVTLNAIPWLYFQPAMSDIFSSLKRHELEAAGAWSCAYIAVAIEMYSQEHGKLPTTLADLVPKFLDELPAEPFYGEPFVYETYGSAGKLSFAIPDMKRDYIFKVFANRESIKQKKPKKSEGSSRLCD